MVEKIKLLKSFIVFFDNKELWVLFIGMILLGVFEVAGIASIVPFMNMIADISIIETNPELSKLYKLLDFKNTNDFLLFSGIIVLVFIVASNILATYMHWRIHSLFICKNII